MFPRIISNTELGKRVTLTPVEHAMRLVLTWSQNALAWWAVDAKKMLLSQAKEIESMENQIKLLRSALPFQYHSRKDWYMWSTQTSMHCPQFKDLTDKHLEFLDDEYAKELQKYLERMKELEAKSYEWVGHKRVHVSELRDQLKQQLDNVLAERN